MEREQTFKERLFDLLNNTNYVNKPEYEGEEIRIPVLWDSEIAAIHLLDKDLQGSYRPKSYSNARRLVIKAHTQFNNGKYGEERVRLYWFLHGIE